MTPKMNWTRNQWLNFFNDNYRVGTLIEEWPWL